MDSQIWLNVLAVTIPVITAIITLYTRVAKLETLISIKMDIIQRQLSEVSQSQKDLWQKYGNLEGRVDAIEKSILKGE
jgi:hypothetical protein